MPSERSPAEHFTDITFEASLASVEQALARLEEGKLPLSESLATYEQGIKHLKQCYRLLEKAEAKIELVTGIDAEGRASTKPLPEGEAASAESSPSSPNPRKGRKSRQNPPADQAGGDVDGPQGLF